MRARGIPLSESGSYLEQKQFPLKVFSLKFTVKKRYVESRVCCPKYLENSHNSSDPGRENGFLPTNGE